MGRNCLHIHYPFVHCLRRERPPTPRATVTHRLNHSYTLPHGSTLSHTPIPTAYTGTDRFDPTNAVPLTPTHAGASTNTHRIA